MADQTISSLLWRRKILTLTCVLVTVLAAVILTARQEKVYESAALLRINAPNGAESSTIEADQGLATTYAEVLGSRSFLERIAPRVADGQLTADALQENLVSERVEETSLVQVRALGSSPEKARTLARDVAIAFLVSLREDAAARARRQRNQIAAFSRRIDPRRGDDDVAGRDALARRGAQLVTNAVAQGSSATLVASPSASGIPVRPRPVFNVAAALVLGLLAGVGLAWLRERLNPALHDSEDALATLDVPLLASVPLRRRQGVGDRSVAEAYDVLRANLLFQSRERSLSTVVFLSHDGRVGRTSAVEGVARAAVRAGSSVVMVDGDLRGSGALSRRFGHGDSRGLSDAAEPGTHLGPLLVELAPGLTLLPAGTPVGNAPGLLSGTPMQSIIAQLRERFDLVIIDAPPVAHLADGRILASLADGAVLVARTGRSSRRSLLAARTSLEQTGTPIVGVVVFEPLPAQPSSVPAGTRPPDRATADVPA